MMLADRWDPRARPVRGTGWVDAELRRADQAPKATSVVGGLRMGDLVRAVVPASSVKAGTSVGRIAGVRQAGAI